jgi:hypothetical protein
MTKTLLKAKHLIPTNTWLQREVGKQKGSKETLLFLSNSSTPSEDGHGRCS